MPSTVGETISASFLSIAALATRSVIMRIAPEMTKGGP